MREMRERSQQQARAAQLLDQQRQFQQDVLDPIERRARQETQQARAAGVSVALYAAPPVFGEELKRVASPALRQVTNEQFAKLEAASCERVFSRYPSLKDVKNPWRQKLDAYVKKQSEDPKRAAFFNRSDWPERIVLEFGVTHGIASAAGDSLR